MAFLASQAIPAKQLERAQFLASRVKAVLGQLVADSAAGNIQRSRLISVMGQLSSVISEFNAIADTPGLAQYAKDQFNDQAINVAAEFTAMVNSITALRDWIFNNFPTHPASGAWLLQTFNTAGVATELTFTSAELATFRSNANAVIATIA